ncbi:DEAD/DEAH box helicase family protein [Embleya sp. NBC_00888]|uniref:DEAD/DEAH box helicase family protein n=1 Tax=Embleya sp. NBC_00888 TaxID=2975960 RepID=UPI002F911672
MQESLPLFPAETSPHPTRWPLSPLRPHQREAVDAIIRALENPETDAAPDGPHGGARATAVMACGTGKTRIAAAVAAALAPRGRVLVLVPTLDLLTQTVTAWQGAGRTAGNRIAVCSLAGDRTLDEAGVRCTTSAPRIALWAAGAGPLTVFATYQSLGAVLTAHQGAYGLALAGFDLVIVDEAHRTSGSIGKEWAAVHDNTRLPPRAGCTSPPHPGCGNHPATAPTAKPPPRTPTPNCPRPWPRTTCGRTSTRPPTGPAGVRPGSGTTKAGTIVRFVCGAGGLSTRR